MRLGISFDLGFSRADRHEAARRTAEVAGIACEAGLVTVVARIAPALRDREAARAILKGIPIVEVFCNAAVESCAGRDPDRLYERALAGEQRRGGRSTRRPAI